MKTLKQIAEEMGETKQRVSRYVARAGIEPTQYRYQTRLYDEKAEKAIKQGLKPMPKPDESAQSSWSRITFGTGEPMQGNGEPTHRTTGEAETQYTIPIHFATDQNLNDQVGKTIDLLSQQLAEKDKQIDDLHEQIHELHDRLKEAINLTDQQQQLQLHQAHLLTAGGSASEPVDAEEAEEEEDGDQAETDTDAEPSAEDEAEPEAETPPEEKAEEETPVEPAPPASDQAEAQPKKKGLWSRLFGS